MRCLTLININNKGFTLIEAMICLFLVSIGLLATSRMQIGSLNGNQVAMETLQASAIASAVSNRLACSAFESDISINVADQTGATSYPFVSGLDPRYTTRYTVQDVPLYALKESGVVDSYKIIRLTTTWTRKGQPHAITNMFIKLNDF